MLRKKGTVNVIIVTVTLSIDIDIDRDIELLLFLYFGIDIQHVAVGYSSFSSNGTFLDHTSDYHDEKDRSTNKAQR